MLWEELGKALCLMMILEGMAPFLMPEKWQSWLQVMTKIESNHIRLWGGAIMLLGTAMLIWLF